MGYSLKFEHPHFPEGKEFALNFLGSVENGGSLEITEDAERTFVANNGISIEDAFKSNSLVTISGSSSLDKEEQNQLIAQANPEPVEQAAPQASNAADSTDDPNALILGEGGEK